MILAASQMAHEDASLKLGVEQLDRVGVFTGTAIGGQGWALREYGVFLEKGLSRLNPFTAISTFPNASSAQISRKFGFVGPSITVSSGCVSSTLALGYAVDNIRLGRIDCAFVGGTEAPLEPGIFAAYCAARVMTSEKETPDSVPKPFDQRRDGIVLSEGAGVIVCESLDHAIRRGARIYAEVCDWAHTSDSANMMMINPDGKRAEAAIRQAVATSLPVVGHIGMVLAHAAGSKADDKTEIRVLQSVFGNLLNSIPVTSAKSMLGHSQGACGAIESIIATLSIFNGVVCPTINCDSIDPECHANIVRNSALITPLNSVLMNTFGFGGKNVSVVFGAVETNASGASSDLHNNVTHI
jgi:3-oxoacyl-[acyl-carrier-protein] synthase II